MNGRDTVLALLLALLPGVAHAASCTPQSQVAPGDRAAISQAALSFSGLVQKNGIPQLKESSLSSIQAQFGGIASGVDTSSSQIQNATFNLTSLYLLDATDLQSAQDTQFFCGISGSSQTVILDFPGLPPGKYAVVIIEAQGGKTAERLTWVLGWENQWKLAGFYPRPMTAGGHDGVWYWTQARNFAQKKQNWNAYYYYQTARWLLAPADFLSSPNLDKLEKEVEKVKPAEVPEGQTLSISDGKQSWKVTSINTDGTFGGLDLSVTYQGEGAPDQAVARTECISLMKALLTQHPEFREAFHGLWIHAQHPGQPDYAVELPINQVQ